MLTAKQREARAENEKVLWRNFPGVNSVKLQNELAENICNVQGWQDRRDELRAQLTSIAKKHRINLRADVSGDPRGYCLKLHLPDGSHNRGGRESGWGIGNVE